MTLNKQFFNRKTIKVARDLVGCYLCRQVGGKVSKYLIRETEAYVGPHDLASHSSKGRTKRTEVMYAEPGTIYIYLIYGMHNMLNVVTEEKDFPAAVLIRGVEGFPKPGLLTKGLQINRDLNNLEAKKKNGLWFESRKADLKLKIFKTPRIGVSYAGPVWANKKLRFVLGN